MSSETITISKKSIKNVLTVIISLTAGFLSIFFLQGTFCIILDITNIFNTVITDLLLVIAGTILVLSVCGIVFCFIKERTWLYRGIAAFLSLFMGATLLYNRLTITDASENVMVYIWASLFYTAVVFALSLLVQQGYKWIKNKRARAM